MLEGAHVVSTRTIKSIPYSGQFKTTKSSKTLSLASKITVVSRRNDFTQGKKRNYRTPRRLITISTGDGRWHGKWNSDYLLSFHDLQLDDLIEDGQQDALVSINLCIHKHASFGFSVDGRITTSFTTTCSNCSSPYCREIDTTFNVWVLASSRNYPETPELPEIGGDDPSVIYVKPGSEAELDSLIQDTLRLATSVKDSCCESCEKSEFAVQVDGGGEKSTYFDKRWSRLLELTNANLSTS